MFVRSQPLVCWRTSSRCGGEVRLVRTDSRPEPAFFDVRDHYEGNKVGVGDSKRASAYRAPFPPRTGVIIHVEILG